MDINKEKEKVATTIHELKHDIEILSGIVEEMLNANENVKTKEDALSFNKRFEDIEKHFKHIRLF